MKHTASQINEVIANFTDVFELTLSWSGESGYSLTLVLTKSDRTRVMLECVDVSGLAVAEFGGGLTQFLCLRAEDVKDAQLDRVALHFSDLERGVVAFDCASASVRSV